MEAIRYSNLWVWEETEKRMRQQSNGFPPQREPFVMFSVAGCHSQDPEPDHLVKLSPTNRSRCCRAHTHVFTKSCPSQLINTLFTALLPVPYFKLPLFLARYLLTFIIYIYLHPNYGPLILQSSPLQNQSDKLFFFFAFQGCTCSIRMFPGQGSYWSYGCQPTPQPQPHRIRAISAIYTSAHGNAGSLTH